MDKALGVDKNGIQKVMRGKDYAGDAMGQVALNTITCLAGQLTYFYTDKIGMAAAAAGTVLLTAKLIDALTDLIMGRVVDKTNSKYGKARPWLLWMIIPTMAAIVALFAVPKGLGSGGMAVYGIASNVFASAICYTAIAVPFYCLIAYATKSIEERGKMGTARSAVGYAIGVGTGIGLIPITNMLGGGQVAWIKVAAAMSVLSGIGLFIAFKFTKERFMDTEAEKETENKVSVAAGLKMLCQNGYWVKITIVLLCLSGMYGMIMAAPVFYAAYIVGDDNFFGVINAVNIIPSVIGFLSVGPLIKRFGLTKTAKIAVAIGIAGAVVRCVFPANVMVTLIFGSLVMYATVPLISVGPAMVMNTVEYNVHKFGVKMTGMTNSANSFAMKVGGGLGGAAIGWVLALGGYTPAEKTQSPAAINSIYALNIWIPLAIFIVIFLLLWKYDLDDRYEALVEENAKRRITL